MLDEEKRDEEGGMRRKEGRGGRKDDESEKMKKLLKEMKNEKVAKGRIIGLAGPSPKRIRTSISFYASYLPLICLP